MSVGQPSQPLGETSNREGDRFVGAFTRVSAWVIDALLINVVAIVAGLGVVLVTAMFPIPRAVQGTWEAVAGAIYVLWYAVYFVTFWATTGQTPGARVLQIRLVGPRRSGIGPARALLRWVGMQLAAIPLFAGYLPVLLGRRPFPDWLARTKVVDAPEISLALAKLAELRAQREALRGHPPATAP